MDFKERATEKTVTSPLTGRQYVLRRIGWSRRNRLIQKAGGNLAILMAETIKECCISPKISDADLDNPNGLPSAEWDWLFHEIAKEDLAGFGVQTPPSADTIRGLWRT